MQYYKTLKIVTKVPTAALFKKYLVVPDRNMRISLAARNTFFVETINMYRMYTKRDKPEKSESIN